MWKKKRREKRRREKKELLMKERDIQPVKEKRRKKANLAKEHSTKTVVPFPKKIHQTVQQTPVFIPNYTYHVNPVIVYQGEEKWDNRSSSDVYVNYDTPSRKQYYEHGYDHHYNYSNNLYQSTDVAYHTDISNVNTNLDDYDEDFGFIFRTPIDFYILDTSIKSYLECLKMDPAFVSSYPVSPLELKRVIESHWSNLGSKSISQNIFTGKKKITNGITSGQISIGITLLNTMGINLKTRNVKWYFFTSKIYQKTSCRRCLKTLEIGNHCYYSEAVNGFICTECMNLMIVIFFGDNPDIWRSFAEYLMLFTDGTIEPNIPTEEEGDPPWEVIFKNIKQL
eukprot:TRINITY_DN697_c0_g1_i1.p1 TRINITY_DN697_c0_g1~~TRINITY_DN697_c0_g1_i1.p1  ORF type:complete len:338 (+),score=55.38 TRINITY_DN697_c0_g1_i1:397-1410(+)